MSPKSKNGEKISLLLRKINDKIKKLKNAKRKKTKSKHCSNKNKSKHQKKKKKQKNLLLFLIHFLLFLNVYIYIYIFCNFGDVFGILSTKNFVSRKNILYPEKKHFLSRFVSPKKHFVHQKSGTPTIFSVQYHQVRRHGAPTATTRA